MFKNIAFVFAFLMATCCIQAQPQGYLWHFGEGAILNFTGNGPLFDTTSAIVTFEGSASIADAQGNLLFYTNGGGRNPATTGQDPGTVWNRNNEVMYNMQGIEGGGFSAAQSALIIPNPGNANRYYIFTMDEIEAGLIDPPVRGFSYFEVDMTQNGGLGAVVNYVESVVGVAFEALAGTKNANGSDYWVVIYNGATQLLNVFAVTSAGVTLSGTFPIPGNPASTDVIRISPDGRKLFTAGFLFDFNTTNGVLSNPVQVGGNTYSATFSPNSLFLYLFAPLDTVPGNELLRFTTDAPDVPASREQIAQIISPSIVIGQLQVAPDANLYFIENDFAVPNLISLSRVQCANTQSPCLQRGIFQYPYQTYGFLGLPNFTDHLFASNFENNPIPVFISATPPCTRLGETVTLSTGGPAVEKYLWSTGDTTPTITVSQPGVYSVTVSNGCCATGSAAKLILDGNDQSLTLEILGGPVKCDTTPLFLSASTNRPASYVWSTGATSSSISVNSPGIYSVVAVDSCGVQAEASITVVPQEPLELDTAQINALPCGGADTLQVITNGTRIEWSNGEQGTSFLAVALPGFYQVTVSNGCETKEALFEVAEPAEPFEMPTAFSPNGDLVNDVFEPVWQCRQANSYRFRIFSRWGQELFNTTDVFAAWNGNDAPSDVYFYLIEYIDLKGKSFSRKGDVTLFR